MKILAIVDTGKQTFYSLDERPEMIYEKHGSLLIGKDKSEVFYDVLIYEGCGPTWKAFGGREFDLPMADGSTTHCYGQYWSGGTSRAEELLGIKLARIAAESVSELARCYVYSGYHVDVEKFETLIKISNPDVHRGEDAYKKYKSIVVRQNLINEFLKTHEISEVEVMDFLKRNRFVEENGGKYGNCLKERKGLKVFDKIITRYGSEEKMSNNSRKMYGMNLKRKRGKKHGRLQRTED